MSAEPGRAPHTDHWALDRAGGTVRIRELVPADQPALTALLDGLPPRDRYLRFFTLSSTSARRYTDSLLGAGARGRPALGAFRGDQLLGVASYARSGGPATAEFALVVDHRDQAHGMGTLLMEALVSRAGAEGVDTLTADVLAENTRMTRLLTDLGLPMRCERDGSVLGVTITLAAGERYRGAVDARERTADLAGLEPVLRPRSVAVIGAGRAAGSVGRAVLANILRGGFTGALTAVNPNATSLLGVSCVPSVGDLADAPDLVVLCVPAPVVPTVLTECAAAGAKAALVITSGITGPLARQVRAIVRAHGMRMVGPNCLGLVNTHPDVRLDATFAAHPTAAGEVGVLTQSGGVAIVLAEALTRIGAGVSTLVSTGDKLDVSGNDLLHWWTADPGTTAVAVYLESFGNPRRFARLARGLSAVKPVVVVRAGVSDAGRRAAGSHTAALASPTATLDALYHQAGLTPVDSLAELVDALALFTSVPLPAGPRTAVVTNAGGAGVLAADACARHGLVVPEFGADTLAALRAVLPPGAAAADPVDTTAAVGPEVMTAAVAAVLGDDSVDAVVALCVPTALGDPTPGVLAAVSADSAKPVLLVRLGQASGVAREPVPGGGFVPGYADPDRAVRALAHAVHRRRWLDRPRTPAARPGGVDRGAIERLVAAHPDGGWLDPAESLALLAAAGVPVQPGRVVAVEHAAEAAAAELVARGRPLALKAVTDGVLHKAKAGGLALGLCDHHDISAAVTVLRENFGDRLRGVFVQAMAEPGTELLVGVRGDPRFGPLVVFGAGGTDAEAGTHTARLCPLAEADLTDLAHEDTAVADVLRRVGHLADTTPEIAELDVNPVIRTPAGVIAVDARVRLVPASHADPLARVLRGEP
ncbi:GNAT family N-acetyltransferase [Actinokineospora auranticolor]|uniref:Acyl-CoA synthetase (NDP forming) n=1 Tax=Actinokineospora auranticolor TaxID=155976 RepID=A0A2S6GPW1_9PSEU|nr:GNAT family N-acetyltransferase [Actinokineospora auranticolor]PPK67236.1 acyl-CoA synthetase (NDP forming) [Actinokineospora auranticolor]